MTIELASMEAIRQDGTSYPIVPRLKSIESLNIVDRQILLAETFLPPGKYREFRIRIPKARLIRGSETVDLAVPPDGFSLGVDLEMSAGETTPLFMSWNVEESIERQVFFRPAFAFIGRTKEPRGVLAYVTNEDSNSVTIIDRSIDRVIDVIEVGVRPKGIVVSPDSSRAFIVNSGSHSLTILDLRDQKILHTANLEIGANPSDVAIHPEGRTLYIANTALNSVSVVDSASFQTIDLIPVGQRPASLALDPGGTTLLVANSGDNTVSVIDTRRNRISTTVPVEFQPVWVAVDSSGTRALVAHLRSLRLVMISLSSLQVERKVNVGIAAAAVPDGNSPRVFIALPTQNRLSYFDLNIDGEIGSVTVGREPSSLALDRDRGKVYVVDRGSDSITVVERDTRRKRTEIPTGKRPYDIAIVR
ncbi:MAG: beta-propeller fold lactonase family protein [Deltaproteobacteria bacterium]|nr:beta-propeller fold lactonase family protein [Deltaproteobacteria bacterium]